MDDTERLEGHKVVTAHEMQRIEGMAFASGSSEEQFMDNAGKAIAAILEEYIEENEIDRSVTLLVGKGNNGGDAYVAGCYLIDKGFSVQALHVYSLDTCGPLCQKMSEGFVRKGGRIKFVHTEKKLSLGTEGIILDGLVGTGFHGKPDGPLASAIEAANASGLPIIAIDIPSGLCGNSGKVESVAINAEMTIYLGCPKWGFFIEDGWNHVGDLVYADFGLPKKFIADADAIAYLVDEARLACLVPKIKRTRHKYDAGYVIGIAGSPGMPGAAILSSYATLRTGAGIIRLFHPCGMEDEFSGAPYELVREGWNLSDNERIFAECKRADAVFMGPGLGREKRIKHMLKSILQDMPLPCVLDADALYFLAEHPSWQLPAQCILTPHRKEMARLLEMESLSQGEKPWIAACQEYSEKKQATVVLKGAPTFLFHPKTKPLIITRGDPGMATAGTGDVLTGMIAALCAQKLSCRQAAALGVALHGMAGEAAASEITSYSMTASDVMEAIPEAYLHLFLGL